MEDQSAGSKGLSAESQCESGGCLGYSWEFGTSRFGIDVGYRETGVEQQLRIS
jgi:hypothetical protein